MKQSQNKKIGNNKYYNCQKGNNKNGFFFIIPSILVSSKKFLNWETMMRSIYIGWGKYYIQYNIYETIKDTNTVIEKKDMQNLFNHIFKAEHLTLSEDQNNLKLLLDYLNQNPYLIQILKNGNLEHPYIKSLLVANFINQPFLSKK